MAKVQYSEVVAAIQRAVRVFVSTGMAEVALVRPNWGDPEAAVKAIAVAFVSGVIAGIFKYLRDKEVVPVKLPL